MWNIFNPSFPIFIPGRLVIAISVISVGTSPRRNLKGMVKTQPGIRAAVHHQKPLLTGDGAAVITGGTL